MSDVADTIDDTAPDTRDDAAPEARTPEAAPTVLAAPGGIAGSAALTPSLMPVPTDADAGQTGVPRGAATASAAAAASPQQTSTMPAPMASGVPAAASVDAPVAPVPADAPMPTQVVTTDGSTGLDLTPVTASTATRTTAPMIPPTGPPASEAPDVPSGATGPNTSTLAVDDAPSGAATADAAIPPSRTTDPAMSDGSPAAIEGDVVTAGSARPVVRHGRATGGTSAPSAMMAATEAAVVSVDAAADAEPSAPASVATPAGPTTQVMPGGERRVTLAADAAHGVAPEPTAPPLATTPGERAGHGLPVSVPSLSIDLSDEGLGPLTLQAQQGAGGVHVRLTAADATVSDLLARSGAELRRDLEAGGTTLGSLDISHGDGSQRNAAWAGTDHPGDRRTAVIERRAPVTAIDTPIASAVRAPARHSTHDLDGVDVRI
jgi:hypothetical protein